VKDQFESQIENNPMISDPKAAVPGCDFSLLKKRMITTSLFSL